jgi:hypothetical protein
MKRYATIIMASILLIAFALSNLSAQEPPQAKQLAFHYHDQADAQAQSGAMDLAFHSQQPTAPVARFVSNQEPDSLGEDAQGDVLEPAEDEETALQRLWAWLKSNWLMALFALLGIIEIIVHLTPTERDNAWFKWLMEMIDRILPNRRAPGGVHPPPGA